MKWECKTIKIGVIGFCKGVDFDENEVIGYINEPCRVVWKPVSSFDTNERHGNSLRIVPIFNFSKDFRICLRFSFKIAEGE